MPTGAEECGRLDGRSFITRERQFVIIPASAAEKKFLGRYLNFTKALFVCMKKSLQDPAFFSRS
jgi:hypothetical protein